MEWPPSLLSHREHLVLPFFYIWCKASYLQTFIDQKILSGSRIKGASAGKISLVFFHFLRMVKGQELLLSLKQKQISQESKKRVRQSICHQQQRQFFCSLEWWQVFPQNSNKNLLKKLNELSILSIHHRIVSFCVQIAYIRFLPLLKNLLRGV